MKHFTIQLIDSGRQTREWSLWANTLTVGSDPRSALVLPAPMPAHVGSFRADAVVALPFGQLLVHEDTPVRQRLWEVARERIAKSRLLGWNEPGEKGRNARAAVLAGLGAIFAFSAVGMYISGGHRPVVGDRELTPDITILVPLPEEKLPDPPKPDLVETPMQTEAQNNIPDPNPNQNGPTESRTVAQAQNTPAAVMVGSVIDKITTMTDGLEGEDVDANSLNVIDVILAGKGGHLTKGDRGGMGAGEGDRMAASGGYGLGTGIGNGIGTDPRATGTKLKMGLSNRGGPVATKKVVLAPRPSDIELGGEAGSRSPESILRVIRSHIGGFRYSYEKALKQSPDIGGKISLKFTIAPDGTVVAIDVVSSTTGVASLDDEIKDKARRMKFDSIEKGNVTVTYAFVLDRQ